MALDEIKGAFIGPWWDGALGTGASTTETGSLLIRYGPAGQQWAGNFLNAVDTSLTSTSLASPKNVYIGPGEYRFVNATGGEATITASNVNFVCHPEATFQQNTTNGTLVSDFITFTGDNVTWTGGKFYDNQQSSTLAAERRWLTFQGDNCTVRDTTFEYNNTTNMRQPVWGVAFDGGGSVINRGRVENCTFLAAGNSTELFAYNAGGLPVGCNGIYANDVYDLKVIGNTVRHRSGFSSVAYFRNFLYANCTEHLHVKDNTLKGLWTQLGTITGGWTQPTTEANRNGLIEIGVSAGNTITEGFHMDISGNEFHDIGADYLVKLNGGAFGRVQNNNFGRCGQTFACIGVPGGEQGGAGGGLMITGNAFHNIGCANSAPQPCGSAVYMKAGTAYIDGNEHTLVNGTRDVPRHLYAFGGRVAQVRIGDFFMRGQSGAGGEVPFTPYWFENVRARSAVTIKNDYGL